MGFDPNADLYALVIYLPDPLGSFLDDLRVEMVPGCNPHAHISVLPPRPLPEGQESAIEHARRVLAASPAFEIGLGEVEIFPRTDVIYIGVERGTQELRQLHGKLNEGALAFAEPFPYHPHLTLGQELDPSQVERMQELATRRWREYTGPRSFRAERSVFVRNTRGNGWVDLAEGPLGR